MLTTKYTCAITSGDVNAGGNHRKGMVHDLALASQVIESPHDLIARFTDDIRRGCIEGGHVTHSFDRMSSGIPTSLARMLRITIVRSGQLTLSCLRCKKPRFDSAVAAKILAAKYFSGQVVKIKV